MKVKVDFRPTVIEGRVYENDDGSYENRTPFVCSFVMHMIGGVVEVTLLTRAAENAWDRSAEQAVFEYAKKLGAEFIGYEIKGRRVTRKLIESPGKFRAVTTPRVASG